MKKIFVFASLFIFFNCQKEDPIVTEKVKFNDNWFFLLPKNQNPKSSFIKQWNKEHWEHVQLPHTPRLEPKVVNNQWQGICWYKKEFTLKKSQKNKKLFLHFEGAMNIADIWLNDVKLIKHQGGYLPFTLDITKHIFQNKVNTLTVRLDNKDNPITGPKPLSKLDFNTYGGIYRNVWLITKNNLYITDPILESKVASGGVFVTYPFVSESEATLNVQVHIRNDDNEDKQFLVKHTLLKDNEVVATKTSTKQFIKFTEDFTIQSNLVLKNPKLWSPSNPNLYKLKTELLVNNKVIDKETHRIGIKTMSFKGKDFYLNGKKLFLRGVNRHQEYPYVGYALSDNAQYRDAKKIKDAGFNYVRLSHYPHSKSFMDACDELGLININTILGWQYFSKDSLFQSHIYQTAKDLIRRDRNHASVMAWEVSLNESWMPKYFIDSLTSIAKVEYPNNQLFTAGWQSYGYDIYLQARQHRLQHYDPSIQKPYNISEYGDWEYYAMNAGLNQDSWSNLLQKDRSSRQLRSAGEIALLQQATNIQEAHNDNLSTPAFADGYWVMFDYNRGYADDIEASGIMDLFRIPKFSHYFYQSQRDMNHPGGKPILFIANYWQQNSSLDIRVFSNCDMVELFLNGKSLGKQKPDINRISSNLKHAPFTFKVNRFEKGKLTAVGYLNNNEVIRSERRTPKESSKIEISVDNSWSPIKDELFDLIFVYAKITDDNGTLVPGAHEEIEFTVKGNANILGPNEIISEAGIATVLVRINSDAKDVIVSAKHKKTNKKYEKKIQ